MSVGGGGSGGGSTRAWSIIVGSVGVCVNLGTGQRRPFPILELTKARWTCPPP